MPNLLTYPPKILLAFGETIGGGKDILEWFLKNGYAELAALSYAVQGSDEAVEWLLKNGYPELAALDSAPREADADEVAELDRRSARATEGSRVPHDRVVQWLRTWGTPEFRPLDSHAPRLPRARSEIGPRALRVRSARGPT